MKKYFKNNSISINVLLVTLAVFFIYQIWDKIFAFLNGSPLNNLSTLGATLTDTQAQNKADSLYVAMHGYGTDEQKIYSELKDISRPNFNKVFKFFGKKIYSPELGLDGTILIDKNQNLLTWLNEELNKSEIDYLKQIAPNVFL